jgi:hypothetical protein
MIQHCLNNRLIDGGKVVSLTHRPRSSPQKHISASGTHFCYRLSKPQGLVRQEGSGELKKIIYLLGSRIRDLPECDKCHKHIMQWHFRLPIIFKKEINVSLIYQFVVLVRVYPSPCFMYVLTAPAENLKSWAEESAFARQRLGTHVPMATNTDAETVWLLDTVFSKRRVSCQAGEQFLLEIFVCVILHAAVICT